MNRRYYQIGGVTIEMDSDLPFQESTFAPKFDIFRVPEPGKDVVRLHHHFSLPHLTKEDLGIIVYDKPPWRIHQNDDYFNYLMIGAGNKSPSMMGIFSQDYQVGHIYSRNEKTFRHGNLESLTMFPTDQIFLSPLFANRRGCIIHGAGMVIENKGFLFIGHSEAGKSTTVTMLQEEGDILCDDRIIVRQYPENFTIHGTWSHGSVPIISPGFAPLQAVMFIEKSSENRLIPMTDRNEVLRLFPEYVIKSLVTPDWWLKVFDVLGNLVQQVPVYRLRLDKTGAVKKIIRNLLS